MKEVTVANEVTDPAFGFPNPASQCHTCGAKDYRTCEGMDQGFLFFFGALVFVFMRLNFIYNLLSCRSHGVNQISVHDTSSILLTRSGADSEQNMSRM